MIEPNSDAFNLRFGGITRLYGIVGAKVILNSHVMVIGLGGVGSWAAESLARSGIGNITLVDLDDICITNTNRQIQATTETFGQSKAVVLKNRILSINPQCRVQIIEDFFTNNTAESILENAPLKIDFVIDAIDSLYNKSLLVSKCLEKNIPLIITGGAAGKTDPTKILIQDLGDSSNDSLLFRMRKQLRREFNFPSGAKFSAAKRQKFNVFCVYSPEDPFYPTKEGTVCKTPDPETNLTLDCESGMGSVSHITAIFGFMAAGFVVNSLTKSTINYHLSRP